MADVPPIVYDLTIGQAAAYLGVHVDSLSAWADAGWVRCWRTPGGHRRFNRADLDAFRDDRAAAG